MQTLSPSLSLFSKRRTALLLALAITLSALATVATAAGVTGAALKPAFDAINDIVGGYGKQIIVIVAFVAAVLGAMALNATGAILKFLGIILFLSFGLGVALTLSGAVI